jgi:perosamine synthetase
VQLARLDSILRRRRELAATYEALLANSPVRAPSARGAETHTYQSYVVQLPSGADRTNLLRRLREQGIEAAIGTHHIPLTQFYSSRYGFRPGDFPVTDDVAARALTLPLHHALTRDSQEFVVSRLLAELV